MKYEIRNQFGNVPYIDGLRDEIIHSHNNGRTSIWWNGDSIDILGHKVVDGTMVINIYIHGI